MYGHEKAHWRRADEVGYEHRLGKIVDLLWRADLLDTPWFMMQYGPPSPSPRAGVVM